MTAEPADPVPGTAVDLAQAMWEHPCDVSLWHRLLAAYEPPVAHRLWLDATTLLEQRCPRTRTAGPHTHDRAYRDAAGVCHDPVPYAGAAACGLVISDLPDGSGASLGPPDGDPCPTCFGATR